MIKFLVFLVILVILFGVETTRALVFGGASIIGLVILGLIAVVFLIYVYDALRDKRTPEQKAKDKEKEKGDPRANAFAYIFCGLALATLAGMFIYYMLTK